MSISSSDFRRLSVVAWCEELFGSLTTSRSLRRRDVMRLVSSGLVESAGLVVLCDADGYTRQPERYVEGFRLTSAGRSVLAEHEAKGMRTAR